MTTPPITLSAHDKGPTMKRSLSISPVALVALATTLVGGSVSVARAQSSGLASETAAPSSIRTHGSGTELRQIIALQRAQLGELRIIARDLATHPIAAKGTVTPGSDGLSLAGCSYDKRMYPKGTTITPAPGMAQTCTDAIRGKPTYGLAWHMVNAASTNVPVPKG
jgi:hypothetical protein